MQVISGAPQQLPQGLYAKVAHYRQRVFVEQLGWALQIQDGMEADQFDRPDTFPIGCRYCRKLTSYYPHLAGLR